MEQRDLKLIEKYMNKDNDLKRLYKEHLDFENRLEKFKNKLHLTPEEEIEETRIKKHKLRGRDQIENILRRYREAEKAS